jgi:sulfide dehydrogenase cytochrome subunit
MTGKILLASLLTLGLMMPISAMAASEGEALAEQCGGCHGTGGASPGSIPSIGQKTPAFIKKSMMESKAGVKLNTAENTLMTRIAKGYTDQQIELIAEAMGSSR